MAIALLFGSLTPMPISHALSLADCIAVTSTQYRNSTFGKTYEVTVKNACGDSVQEALNYSSISFYASSSTLNPETQSIYYLQSYGKTFSFKIKVTKGGVYEPYLQIRVPQDYSNRKIYLPSFKITDPLTCLSASNSIFQNDKFSPVYTVNLMNTCSDVSDSTFFGFYAELKILGFPFISQRQLISGGYSNLRFFMNSLPNGIYYPTLEITDNDFNQQTIKLSPFTVSNTSSTGKSNTSLKQWCSTATDIEGTCLEYPNFKFELCSSLQKGNLQQKSGNTWIKLWNVSGTRDTSSCDSQYPFLISITGTNKSAIKLKMRIVFTKTNKIASFTQYFDLISK